MCPLRAAGFAAPLLYSLNRPEKFVGPNVVIKLIYANTKPKLLTKTLCPDPEESLKTRTIEILAKAASHK